MPPEKDTTAKGPGGDAALVHVTTLRDDPPHGAAALGITTFVSRNLNAPPQTRDAWLQAYEQWFAGGPTPKKAKE